MGCELCGRSSCTRSFHSLEEQDEFDRVNKTDEIKDRLKRIINYKLNRIKGQYIEEDGEYYIKLQDAIDAVDDSD